MGVVTCGIPSVWAGSYGLGSRNNWPPNPRLHHAKWQNLFRTRRATLVERERHVCRAGRREPLCLAWGLRATKRTLSLVFTQQMNQTLKDRLPHTHTHTHTHTNGNKGATSDFRCNISHASNMLIHECCATRDNGASPSSAMCLRPSIFRR